MSKIADFKTYQSKWPEGKFAFTTKDETAYDSPYSAFWISAIGWRES